MGFWSQWGNNDLQQRTSRFGGVIFVRSIYDSDSQRVIFDMIMTRGASALYISAAGGKIHFTAWTGWLWANID
jgi:hypothetical protein